MEQQEREERLRDLEARLSKPATVGVLPPVAALALAGTLAVMWMQRAEVAYFFSSRDPIDLGVEGSYAFDRARSNRYAQIHGVPTLRGAYFPDKDRRYVAIGVTDAPLLVAREILDTEPWSPGQAGPRPDQRPFSVRGRLLSRLEAERWKEAFVQHDAFGLVDAKWLLLAEQRPGGDFPTVAWMAVLMAFGGVNLWLMVRGTQVWLQRLRRPPR